MTCNMIITLMYLHKHRKYTHCTIPFISPQCLISVCIRKWSFCTTLHMHKLWSLTSSSRCTHCFLWAEQRILLGAGSLSPHLSDSVEEHSGSAVMAGSCCSYLFEMEGLTSLFSSLIREQRAVEQAGHTDLNLPWVRKVWVKALLFHSSSKHVLWIMDGVYSSWVQTV